MKLGEKMWTVKCQYESRKMLTGKLRHRGLETYLRVRHTYQEAVTAAHGIRKMGAIVKRRILRKRAEGRLKR